KGVALTSSFAADKSSRGEHSATGRSQACANASHADEHQSPGRGLRYAVVEEQCKGAGVVEGDVAASVRHAALQQQLHCVVRPADGLERPAVEGQGLVAEAEIAVEGGEGADIDAVDEHIDRQVLAVSELVLNVDRSGRRGSLGKSRRCKRLGDVVAGKI